MNENTFTIDGFTWICCAVIVVTFIAAWKYVANTDSKEFFKRRKWIDQLPTIVSTLGVLGTFLGITRGLIAFDPEHIDKSIPVLLEGLKTAFFTSLTGMFGSLILTRIVSHKFDTETEESEEMKAAKLIVEELKTEKNEITTLLSKNQTDLVKALVENDTIRAIRQDVEQLKDDIEEIKGHIEEHKGYVQGINGHEEKVESLVGSIVAELEGMKSATSSNSDEISKVRAVLVTATASISAIDNNVVELNTSLNGIGSDISEINNNLFEIQSYIEEDEDGEE